MEVEATEYASKEICDEKDYNCPCDFGSGSDGPRYRIAGRRFVRHVGDGELQQRSAHHQGEEAQEGEVRHVEYDAGERVFVHQHRGQQARDQVTIR